MNILKKLPIEIYVTVLFLCFGLFWLFKAYELKNGYSTIVASSVSFTGPYTFPMIISWIIIVSALINLYQSSQKFLRNDTSENAEISATERRQDALRIIGLLIITILYVTTLKIIGFIPATVVLIFVSMVLFGAKSKVLLATVSIGAPIILWVLFKVLIKVQLP